MATVEGQQRVAFGVFELDRQTGELWKAGFRVRLAGQPFKVLVALLDRPGEVVTREELLAHVWGSNTNVDFEQAISGTIKKIREALGDTADNPRFVETLTKRGYRFIAPITRASSTPARTLARPSAGDLQATLERVREPEILPAHQASPVLEGEIDSSVLPELGPPVTSVGKESHHPRSLPGASFWTRPVMRGWSVREVILMVAVLALLPALIVQVWSRHAAGSPLHRISQVTHYVPLSIGPPNVESFLTLAQDGDRILTSVLVDGRSRLSAIIPSTGEIRRITTPDDIASGTVADITRDGSKLLVRSNLSSASEQALWILPSAGGSGQRVAGVLAHDATWMPDGIGILYANENDLSLIRPDDGVSVPYAKLQGRAFWLRWSPDGKLLRFTLMNPVSHLASLWELESGSRQPRPIRNEEAKRLPACCGVWTADGSAYVFQSDNNLWKLTGSGRWSSLSQLTNGPLRFLSPVASRNGSQIFFVGLEPPSGLRQLEEKRGSFQAAPAFLADANRVEYSRDGAWVAWTDVYEKLWRARASDGSDKVQLTSDGTEVFLAHWSPDGRRLAIMARQHGGLWQTYLVDAAGGRPEALLKETRNSADPGWSADGQTLVYGRVPDLMGKESGPRDLQLLNLVTSEIQVLPNSEGLFSPRWSPDGAWIVALSLDQKSLMLYDVKLKRWKQLASTSAADPVWSSDSKSVYVEAFLENREPILKINVPDGATETIADLSSFHDKEAVNYFFSGLTPANEPMVQPRIGTGNLYSLDLSR